MVDKLFGHWKLEKCENLDEYMKAAGINFMLRKVASRLTVYEEIKREGDDWTLHIKSTFKSSELKFKLNEPFKETKLDGREATTEFFIEDDKLVCTHTPLVKDDVPGKFIREVLDDGRLMMTCISVPTNVIAKRYFTRYTPSS